MFYNGELEFLCSKIENIRINQIFFEHANWCIEIERLYWFLLCLKTKKKNLISWITMIVGSVSISLIIVLSIEYESKSRWYTDCDFDSFSSNYCILLIDHQIGIDHSFYCHRSHLLIFLASILFSFQRRLWIIPFIIRHLSKSIMIKFPSKRDLLAS